MSDTSLLFSSRNSSFSTVASPQSNGEEAKFQIIFTMTDIQIKELSEQVASLMHEVHRLKAVNEIAKIMARYEMWHYPHLFHRKIELFATSRPDVSMDLSNAGIFTGTDALNFLWKDLLGKAGNEVGAMFIHPLTSPAIEVAQDGKTAKGVWISPGLETYYYDHKHTCPDDHVPGIAPMRAYWCWGKYACDFALEPDGKWKIWHMKWIRDFRCDYYLSWVDDVAMTSTTANYPTFGRNDIKPCRYHEPYKQKERRKAIPAMPEPYETFDDPDWIYEGYKDVIPPAQKDQN